MAVLSPGIDPVSRLVRNFSSRGIDIIGELELGWRFCQKIPVIAVTGTNGKTTTTELLAQIDRKSTRLNSSHSQISYAVFCLKKKMLLGAQAVGARQHLEVEPIALRRNGRRQLRREHRVSRRTRHNRPASAKLTYRSPPTTT